MESFPRERDSVILVDFHPSWSPSFICDAKNLFVLMIKINGWVFAPTMVNVFMFFFQTFFKSGTTLALTSPLHRGGM